MNGGTRRRRPLSAVAMSLAAMLLLGTAASARAQTQIQPFLHIEVAESYDMGTVSSLGSPYDPPTALPVLVATNFGHGGLMAEISALEHESLSTQIPRSRVFIQQPGSGLYVPMTGPIQLTAPTGPSVFQMDLRFRVNLDFSFPPGTYAGVLTLTVIAP